MKTRTFIAYDKEGNKVRGYILERYNFEELKKYMTLADYEKTDYIQEMRWDSKTTKDENGNYTNPDTWRYDTSVVKHYIHR